MTELVNECDVAFINGAPGFPYEKVYRCFSGDNNGLLFRLVNDKKQWAFYNDTEDLFFRVNAKFGPNSDLKPLGRTKIVEATDDHNWRYNASVTVGPGRTERFVEGIVEGFEVNFASEAMPAESVEFENGAPTVEYETVYKCLKDYGNGLLFRLVSEDPKTGERTWSFYNDTKDFTMDVEVTFANKDCVQPLGNVRVEDAPDNENGAVYKVSVKPLCTEEFLRGDPHDYNLSFVANPMDNEKALEDYEVVFENGSPNPEVVLYPGSKVFKGFKDKGNGLIFLLLDDENKRWAFYNDTTEYNITATVKFGPKSVYEAAQNVSVSPDPDVAGGTVCVLTVPPLTTEPFLTGNPGNYHMSFYAEPVTKTQHEENPAFENEGPDAHVMAHYDKVYKCFKENGNGLLFRLVDEQNNMWGFYNDTKDVLFTVKVRFDNDSKVTPMGKTTTGEDDDLGEVYMLQVEPLATELFVSGEVTGFATKFTGKKYRPV
ncbi:uncharacterized protein TM35_000011220 [Trypanosoma theileri]|uniref:DUF1935 domain-containing protein n=1 Tax=Trypanosoma theileri TaxID=67003 RepID=A0A1X0P8U8_9TRYP|nr:uncharacterized protein TM35_000011220 [Trypanosoma theileri]ORC93245.1 hypothetical protein TM35_000011220 [Trypanosoma theileri]